MSPSKPVVRRAGEGLSTVRLVAGVSLVVAVVLVEPTRTEPREVNVRRAKTLSTSKERLRLPLPPGGKAAPRLRWLDRAARSAPGRG
jgi:hypothetical protein